MNVSDIEIPVSARQVIRETAKAFGMTAEHILGNRRDKPYVTARFIAVYLYLKLRGVSTTDAGRAFRRDHTSIIHANRRAQDILEREPEVKEIAERVEATLRGQEGEDVKSFRDAVAIAAKDAVALAKHFGHPLSNCRKGELLGILEREFGETPRMVARSADGDELTVLTSPRGTWSIIETGLDGYAEFRLTGTGWRNLAPAPMPDVAPKPEPVSDWPRRDKCYRCNKPFTRTAADHRHCGRCRAVLNGTACHMGEQ